MSEPKNRGAAKNPALGNGDLNIPTLGGNAQQTQILQPGESADVLEQAGANAAEANHQGEPLSLADIQRQADAQGRSTQAMHRPASIRQEREQFSEVPQVSMEVPPLSRGLDGMRRPDQYIEPIADLGRFKDKAEELAFLEEIVQIVIHEDNTPGAENPVPLGVNGRMVYIQRGREVFVRRKYVEQLLRAKPESLQTRITRDGDGNPRNFIDKMRALKYPFSIMRDDNPKGRAWERRIRSEA